MYALWGEIKSQVPDKPQKQLLNEPTLQLPQSVNTEGSQLFQPSAHNFPASGTELSSSRSLRVDPLVLHTIELLQFIKKIQSLITATKLQLQDVALHEDNLRLEPTPVIPPYVGPAPVCQLNKPIPFLYKDLDSQFVRGFSSEPVTQVDANDCTKLLRRSVAAVCAHAGYDNCSASTLETLTDVTAHYLQRMTSLLRHAVDDEAESGDSGFPDVMERVFYEMGIGSMTSLHNFYQSRVIKYRENLLNRCRTLQQDYERLKSEGFKPEEPVLLSRTKDESTEAEASIQFPLAADDNDDCDENEGLLLEGLGLDVSTVSHEGSSGHVIDDDTDSRWPPPPHSVKSEQSDSRFDESQASVGTDVTADTPISTSLHSADIPDMLHNPLSVGSTVDIMSPPSAGPGHKHTAGGSGNASKPPLAKKKKKK